MIHKGSHPVTGVSYFIPQAGVPTVPVIFQHIGEHRPIRPSYTISDAIPGPATHADPVDDGVTFLLENLEDAPFGNDILPGDWMWVGEIPGYYALALRKDNQGAIFTVGQTLTPSGATVQRLIGRPEPPEVLGMPFVGSTLTTSLGGNFFRWKIDGNTVSTTNSLALVDGMENKLVILYVDGAPSIPVSISATAANFIQNHTSSFWINENHKAYKQLP